MRRASLVLLSLCRARCLAVAAGSAPGEASMESPVWPQVVPYRLLRVVVVHRHGDRSQIERSAGPRYPESDVVTSAWVGKMPGQGTRDLLERAARKRVIGGESSIEAGSSNDLYSGRDAGHYPYGQLTELGVQQMIAVGRSLRQQYWSLLLGEQSSLTTDIVYARSTDLCRTLMSLRALLVGLFDMEQSGIPDTVPVIEARTKTTETLYPDCNDTPCPKMKTRQQELLSDDYIPRHFPGYHELEVKFKALLGYEHRVRWLTSREVLLCQQLHGIEYTSVSPGDIDR